MQPSSPTKQFQQASFQCSHVLRRLIAYFLVTYLSAMCSFAQPPRPTEYDVKAAYLLNFGKFVRSSRQSPARSSFDICVIGRDPLESSLESIASDTTIDNFPVRIHRLQDVTDARACAVVFLSATENDRIREDLAILGNSDSLTVSDAPDFLQHGGMIQFVLVSNHVRFSVNLDAVSRAHLVLSSELLRVASSVSGKPPIGELP